MALPPELETTGPVAAGRESKLETPEVIDEDDELLPPPKQPAAKTPEKVVAKIKDDFINLSFMALSL
jgi:hypothetical protein